MENQTNIPTLRFPEFKGEWEMKKLGEVAEISSGGTPSRTNPHYWNGNIPWVSTTLIDFNFIDKTEEYITEEGLKNSSAKLFPKGTLLVAMYGQGKTRGKIAVLNINATTNQACGAITTNHKILNPLFAFQNISKRYDEIRDLSNQGGQENLSGGIIKGIEVSFPTLPEQTKIAEFFTAIDKKISQLKTKKVKLQQYKKGVMQQLFSVAESDGRPSLRFKDENGKAFADWDMKKLGEVLSIPEKIKPEKIEKNKLLTVKLHLKGLFKNDSTDGLSIGSTNYYLRKKGQFIYGKQNLFNGAFGIITEEFDGFLTSSDVPALDIDYSKTNSMFLLNFLGRPIFYKKLEEIASGSGSKRIHENIFLNVEINLPSLPEQTTIANFLSSIDEKINHTEIQIQETQGWKKGLLQRMFV